MPATSFGPVSLEAVQGKAPGGVSGVSPESLSPFALEEGELKNLHLRAQFPTPRVGRAERHIGR